MIIFTVQFQYPDRSKYSILLEVFRKSIKLYMPEVKLIEVCIPAPGKVEGRDLNFKYNSVKLRYWTDFLETAKENVIFADCDMMAIRSAYHAFNKPFDVAYTARTKTKRIPMNGGIMMVRPSEASKRFFREMLKINDRMFENIAFHNKWRIRYAGMNQAAFGCVLETGKHGAKIHKYKTIEWNAVDCDWTSINGKTVFIHYKSKLRKMVLRERAIKEEYRKVVQLWDEMRARP